MSRSTLLFSLLGGLLWLFAGEALAHPEGVTLSSLWVAEEGVRLEVVLPDRVVLREEAGRGLGDGDGVGGGASLLFAAVPDAYSVEAGGVPCDRRGEPEIWTLPDIGSHRYVVEFSCAGASTDLSLFDGIAAGIDDSGHENFLRYSAAGLERTEVLTPERPSVALSVAEMIGEAGRPLDLRLPRGETLSPDPMGFVVLGVEHILAGIDHVLFLVGLFLIPMAWRRLLGIVTAFTLGHSVTLGLSALGVYSPTPWIAESVIALSIVYLAAENLLSLRRSSSDENASVPEVSVEPTTWTPRGLAGADTRAAGRRWAIAGGFGLIHGFGFSYVLRDLGLPADSVLASLAGFNVGVELGQLVVVGLLVPALVLVWRVLAFRPISAFGSLAIGLVGCWWVVERTLL